MGAWAEDTFGNDTSCDWVGSFTADPGLDIVRETLQEVLDSDDYLESEEGCNGLAACEVIARLQGNWGKKSAYSEKIDHWVEANPTEVPADLKQMADQAITRILADDSELVELWDEDGYNENWHNEVEDLRKRVNG